MSDIEINLDDPEDINIAVDDDDPISVEMPEGGMDGRSIHPAGEWSDAVEYAYLDLVTHEGSSYTAVRAVPAGTELTDTYYWQLTAEKGDPGDPGTPVWGAITGDLSDQTDLADALLDKAPVILSSASGPIASFTDGSASPVTALSVGIDPVQDLHGYSNPWPAGGGKNILVGKTLSETVRAIDFSFTSDDVLTFSGTNNSSTAQSYFNIYPNESGKRVPIKAGTYTFSSKTALPVGAQIILGFKNQDGTSISSLVLTNSRQSVSGTIAVDCEYSLYVSISESATVSYNGGLQLESGSSATSWTPCSNICPISGHTSAVVTRTGKNLCDQSAVTLGMLTESDGIYSASDADTRSTLYFKLNQYNRDTYIPNSALVSSAITSIGKISLTTMILSGCTKLHFRNAGAVREFYFPMPITPLMWGKQVTFSAYILDKTIGAVKFTEPQLELGQTASDYLPYQPIQTVTIDLDGTRYGGELNVLAGTMTVDRKMVTITDADYVSNVSSASSIRIAMALPDDSMTWSSTTTLSNKIICSGFKESTNELTNAGAVGFHYRANGSHNVVFSFGNSFLGVSTVENARAWIDSNPQQVVYYLATPFTVQLTPSQISTLLGQNNIWADTGDVAVEYRADTKLYIEKLTKPAEDDMTANTNIASGKYFMVGNNLFLSTASIANGETIKPGTNCTALSLADALNNLNA